MESQRLLNKWYCSISMKHHYWAYYLFRKSCNEGLSHSIHVTEPFRCVSFWVYGACFTLVISPPSYLCSLVIQYDITEYMGHISHWLPFLGCQLTFCDHCIISLSMWACFNWTVHQRTHNFQSCVYFAELSFLSPHCSSSFTGQSPKGSLSTLVGHKSPKIHTKMSA